MPSPVIDYTNLLHQKKSLDDPAVLKFKQDHAGDPNFSRQAEVVEWAFRARSMAKTVKKDAAAPVAEEAVAG